MPMINEIINEVKERHRTWSDNLIFATTYENDSALIDQITFNRIIPDDQLDTRFTEEIINGLSIEVINSEIRHFLLELNQHNPHVRHISNQIEMVRTFNTAYAELIQIMVPDFIIWSQGMQGAFVRNASEIEQNQFNRLNLRGVTIQNQFNDIILGARQLCGKTYRNNRLSVIQNRNPDARSTNITFGINQRLDFSPNFTYARIIIQ